MTTSTVYWPAACSLRTRLARSLVAPPRYSTSTPKRFLKASGTRTRASGLGPDASTSLPSFLAATTQLSHCCCQTPPAAPLLAGVATGPPWPHEARASPSSAISLRQRMSAILADDGRRHPAHPGADGGRRLRHRSRRRHNGLLGLRAAHACAHRGACRRRQDGGGQGAGGQPGHRADPAAVLRGAGCLHRAVRMELPKADAVD